MTVSEHVDTHKHWSIFQGPLDPLGLRFDARIVDAQGKEHKSAERYFWLEVA
jgi:hypothetical protein